jgi:hypothetical protein
MKAAPFDLEDSRLDSNPLQHYARTFSFVYKSTRYQNYVTRIIKLLVA